MQINLCYHLYGNISDTTEWLQVENTILKYENNELCSILSVQKQRLSGKSVVLHRQIVVSIEELQAKLAECEATTKAKKKQRIKKYWENATPRLDQLDQPPPVATRDKSIEGLT